MNRDAMARSFPFFKRLRSLGISAGFSLPSGLKNIKYSQTQDAQNILRLLKCRCKSFKSVILEDEGPYLRCLRCKSEVFIDGFLYDLHEKMKFVYEAYFLRNGD